METRRIDAVAARKRRRVQTMAIMFPSGFGMSAVRVQTCAAAKIDKETTHGLLSRNDS